MPQPQDLIIPIERTVTVTESAGVTLRELSLSAATPTQPGVLAVSLGAKDADGEWRTDVPPLLVRKIDKLVPDKDAEGNELPLPPQERYAASMFQELMFSAIVSDTPQHRALGVVGLSVWDAAKVILGKELMS